MNSEAEIWAAVAAAMAEREPRMVEITSIVDRMRQAHPEWSREDVVQWIKSALAATGSRDGQGA